MILYHFTSDENWLRIQADGLIDAQQSKWTQDAPKAISFSTSPNQGALPSNLWGSTVRITVDVPDCDVFVQKHWFKKHLDPVAVENLCDARLHGGDSRHWRTVERSVPASEWTSVDRVAWTQISLM